MIPKITIDKPTPIIMKPLNVHSGFAYIKDEGGPISEKPCN
jgi:hypothetical protein